MSFPSRIVRAMSADSHCHVVPPTMSACARSCSTRTATRVSRIFPHPSPRSKSSATGLCGSDLEKIGTAPAGTVLGHEVVARVDGRRVALVHHRPCGTCERCRSGHESTCSRFREPTIVPGGFAERVQPAEGVELPDSVDDARGTYVEPLACVLRALDLVPRGRVLVVGCGFMGRLWCAVLRRRGDEVLALDPRAERRCAPEPDGPVPAAVLCAAGRPVRRGSSRAGRCSCSHRAASSTSTPSTAAS